MEETYKRILQKRFASLNVLLGIQGVIFFAGKLIFGYFVARETIIFIISIFVLLVLDYVVCNHQKPFGKKIIKSIRYVELTVITVMIVVFPDIILVNYLGIMVYFLFVMENLLTYEAEKLFRMIPTILLLLSPAIVSYVIRLCIIGFDVLVFIEGMGIIGFTFVILMIVSYNIKERENGIEEELKEQKELNIKIKKMNEDLISKQEELEQNSEQIQIQKSQLEKSYEKINRSNSEMMIQNLIQRYISSSLEIEKTMELIAESLSEALVVNLCGIIVQQENKKNSFFVYSRTTFGEEYTEEFRKQIKDMKFVNRYQELTKAFVDNDVDNSKYLFLQGQEIGSLLIFPLIKEEEWLGILVIGKDTKEYFIDNITFFETVSSQIAIAIANAKVYRQVEEFAIKDGLTNIYNRRYLTSQMKNLINTSMIERRPLTVILFDIDKFKTINDTYGHVVGDEVIKECARIAMKIARKNQGFTARYGGEEFVILFQDKNMDQVKVIVENFHEKIKSNRLVVNGKEIQIDISIGVTSYPELCPDPGELLNRADWAMYNSKRNGRGRVTYDSKEINKTM